MTRWLQALFLGIFLSQGANSFAGPQSNKTLLWRISDREMKKPSYLFGTMHMICPEDYVWTPVMQKSMDACEAICLEMDMDAPDIFMQIAQGMMNGPDKKLKDYFSEADYKKLAQFLADSMGIDIAAFGQMKPAALQSMLMEKTFHCSAPVSYEINIMQEAQKSKKEILGLERPEEQLDLFDNLPTDSVVKDLMDIVQGKNSTQDEYNKLITAYKNQDLPALDQLIQSSATKDMDLGGFLDVRNEKWIPRMTEKMDQQSVFFAVGAGHLWGPEGLISLLRKAGYTIEPVK